MFRFFRLFRFWGRTRYHTSKATNPEGEVEWFARYDRVPGPYGTGKTKAAAVEDLERALAFWRLAQSRKTWRAIQTRSRTSAALRVRVIRAAAAPEEAEEERSWETDDLIPV